MFTTKFLTVEKLCFKLEYFSLLAINKDLKKADNPEKYKESMDWFYEKLDKEDKENK